jgi:proline dehydrogenase
MIRDALSTLARKQSLGDLISRAPLGRRVVSRVVGGDTIDDALVVASELADRGLWVSLERAAPTREGDPAAAELLTEYLGLVCALTAAGLGGVSEVAAFPESLDPVDGAFPRLTELSRAATGAGIVVMLAMGPAERVDRTLELARSLHDDGLLVGVTVQANLRRTEDDCFRLADGRVRLVKGGHRAGPEAAHGHPAEIDKAFVRCAKTLLKGAGQPSFATHDPRLIEAVESVAARYGRPRQTYEFCFYMGRQDAEQSRLAAAGDRVRVYVPYGPDWFGRLVGGLAEQPTSIAGAVRSLLPGGRLVADAREPEEA